MPLKRAVLPLLHYTEPLAADVGGANTVVFTPRGPHGYNTDVPGIVAALAEIGVTPFSAMIGGATIAGAGATACAALAAVGELGLAEVVVLVRDQARAAGLLAAASRLGIAVDLRPFTEGVRSGDLLISTVPAGAADIIAERAVVPGCSPAALLDVVYHPWPTPLALAARKAGIPVAGGFDLLLHQAARQVELMTGHQAPLDAMRTAGEAALATRG
jgi:shikimate dehydrogenase